MLVNLILTICISGAADKCRTETLAFESQGDLMKCMFLAPIEIAKWTGEHPKFEVVRWRCKFPGKDEDI